MPPPLLTAALGAARRYIVQEGCMQAGADSDPDAVHFGPGEYFGDVSLLLSEPTETTIKSLGETAPLSSLMHVWI